jgi:hypothetical protein
MWATAYVTIIHLSPLQLCIARERMDRENNIFQISCDTPPANRAMVAAVGVSSDGL